MRLKTVVCLFASRFSKCPCAQDKTGTLFHHAPAKSIVDCMYMWVTSHIKDCMHVRTHGCACKCVCLCTCQNSLKKKKESRCRLNTPDWKPSVFSVECNNDPLVCVCFWLLAFGCVKIKNYVDGLRGFGLNCLGANMKQLFHFSNIFYLHSCQELWCRYHGTTGKQVS